MATATKGKGHDGRGLCGAKKKQGPGTCTQVAGWGTPNTTGPCKLHGGSTRTHKTRAEREAVRQACELFGLEMEHRDPGQVLLDEILRARKAVAWCEKEIALAMQAGDQELVDKRYAQWVVERRIAADVGAKALQLGLQLRAVVAMEDEARRAVAMLEAFVGALGLDRKAPAVLEAGRVALQVLPGGGS